MTLRLSALSVLLLIATLLAPSAAAAPAYTTETLAQLLLSQADVEKATGLSFSATQDLNSRTDPVTVGRAFGVGNGTFVSTHLFSQPGGSEPDVALRGTLKDGTFLRDSLATTFNAIDRYETLAKTPRDGDDVVVSFFSTVRGETYSVVAASFVRGNVYGIVIHAKTSGNEPSVVRAVRDSLTAKLRP